MLVLTIMLVPTISHAQSYIADDSYTLTSQYHDLFNNYFDGKLSYTYFPYNCNYGTYNNRECYFGIDSEGNYLKIDYVQNGNSYETRYTTGIDHDFSVTGSNIIEKSPSFEYQFLLAFIFFGLTLLITFLI